MIEEEAYNQICEMKHISEEEWNIRGWHLPIGNPCLSIEINSLLPMELEAATLNWYSVQFSLFSPTDSKWNETIVSLHSTLMFLPAILLVELPSTGRQSLSVWWIQTVALMVQFNMVRSDFCVSAMTMYSKTSYPGHENGDFHDNVIIEALVSSKTGCGGLGGPAI